MLSSAAIKAMKKDELVATVERLQHEAEAAKDQARAAERATDALASAGELDDTLSAFLHAHTAQMKCMRELLSQVCAPLVLAIEFSKIMSAALEREGHYTEILDRLADVATGSGSAPPPAAARKPTFKPLPEAQWLNLDRMGHQAVEDWLDNFADVLALAGFDPADPGALKALLTSCTAETRQKLKNMGAAASFDAYVTTIKSFTKKRVNKALERMNMQARKQAQHESVSDFLLAIKYLARDCGYAAAELDDVIKQVCISGLHSESLRTKLFEWDNYEAASFEQFMDQASRYEAIEAVSNKFAAKDFVAAEHVNVVKTAYQKAKQGQGFKSMQQQNQPPTGQKGKPDLGKGESKGQQVCLYCSKSHTGWCFTIPCPNCGKTGHSPSRCRKGKPGPRKEIRTVQLPLAPADDSLSEGELVNHVGVLDPGGALSTVKVMFAGPRRVQPVPCLPDSGAAVNCMPASLARDLQLNVLPVSADLRNADRSPCKFVGQVAVSIRLGSRVIRDAIFFVLPDSQVLLSKGACIKLGLLPEGFPEVCVLSGDSSADEDDRDWRRRKAPRRTVTVQAPAPLGTAMDLDYTLHSAPTTVPIYSASGSSVAARRESADLYPSKCQIDQALQALCEEFGDVLIDGTTPPMKGDEFSIRVKQGAEPYAVKAPRPLALSLRQPTYRELTKLVADGVIEPVVGPTEWCAPVVIVPRKGSDRIRLCVDYTMLNRSIDRSFYFSPSPAVSVADIPRDRARFFTKADCLLGYHQVPVEEGSKDLTTFITEFGRFRYIRAPFGVANIAEIFNRKMEDFLQTRLHWSSERRCVDDNLIFSPTFSQHIEHVRDFLRRCREGGISISKKKFEFCKPEIIFAGYKLSPQGYEPGALLTGAIRDFPSPKKTV